MATTTSSADMVIEYVPLDSIKPYPRNAKMHPPEQIEQIKESIRQFGFRDPIGIWNGEIVEGHGRYFAAQDLSMKTVPIIRLDDLTDEQRRAYMLVHNQTTMNSDFDVDLLDIELDDISDIDMSSWFDLGLEENELPEMSEQKEAQYKESLSVVIDCGSEQEAEKIYNALTAEGYECRISTL